jgi:hypothetical protein
MKNNIKRSKTALFVFMFIALALVLTRRHMDEKNLERLDASISEIYNDRLVVEGYIYRMSDLLYVKKILLLQEDGHEGQNKQITAELDAITARYAITKFTIDETKEFTALKGHLSDIQALEQQAVPGEAAKEQLIVLYDKALRELKLLSDIQLQEGKALDQSSRSTLSSSLLTIKLEWGLYILMFITIIAIIKEKIILPARTVHLN